MRLGMPHLLIRHTTPRSGPKPKVPIINGEAELLLRALHDLCALRVKPWPVAARPSKL